MNTAFNNGIMKKSNYEEIIWLCIKLRYFKFIVYIENVITIEKHSVLK